MSAATRLAVATRGFRGGEGGFQSPPSLVVIEASIEALAPEVEVHASDVVVGVSIDGLFIDALVEYELEADVESDHIITG